MKNPLILFAILLFSVCSLYAVKAQQRPVDGGVVPLENQYEEYITTALRLQVRADSLSRLANQKRRELAFLGGNASKSEMENQILSLEQESFRAQKQADSLYSQARAIELRIMSGRKLPTGSSTALPEDGRAEQIAGVNPGSRSLSDQISPDFLTLGEKNISPWLSPSQLLTAKDMERDYARANNLMGEVSDMNDEIARLGQILDGNTRRRERRNINRRIDELSGKSFQKHIEALQIYEKVNDLRYKAATGFLAEKREQLSDSVVIKQGLVHEEIARESFRQAGGLRTTAVDLRSDKYYEGFILRAYTEELKAFNELKKALEIYNDPSLVTIKKEPLLPLQADGRIDAGIALSRARLAPAEPSPSRPANLTSQKVAQGKEMDFGFSILRDTPYSYDNPIPQNVLLPDGIVYSIQIGIFNTEMHPGAFGGIAPVMTKVETGNGSIGYFAGVLRSFNEAEKALIEVNRQGFSDAFIIAYNNGSKIPVNRARQMENNRQHAVISTSPIEQIPEEVAQTVTGKGGVIFKVQLGAFGSPIQSATYRRWQNLAGNKNIEQVHNNNGLYVYSTGNFNTFEEAVRMRNVFREQGVPDAFIVAYKGDDRISLEEANILIQRH